MRYRMLDINGDYCFGKGQQNFTYGIHAVKQAIQTRLNLLKNEWWENVDEGLPLFQAILGTTGIDSNLIVIDNLIKQRILETVDILSIQNFNSSFENRKYTFTASILSKFGEIELDMNF